MTRFFGLHPGAIIPVVGIMNFVLKFSWLMAYGLLMFEMSGNKVAEAFVNSAPSPDQSILCLTP
jgi:hypothetical protein